MKMQRLAIVLRVINFLLLGFAVAQFHPTAAQGVAPVLRGRALEILDNDGRVRASIRIHPAGPRCPCRTARYIPKQWCCG